MRYVGVYNPILTIFSAEILKNGGVLHRNGRKMDGFGLFLGELYDFAKKWQKKKKKKKILSYQISPFSYQISPISYRTSPF
jgi:hypothetical protein